MNRFVRFLMLLAAAGWLTLPDGRAAEWLTDLPVALAKAKAENKLVLVNFTGSDWCGWCIRLKREVFSQKAFDAFAAENLVLVEADFPQRKEQSASLKKANAALARKYQIEGYPTIIALDGSGKQVGQLGYMEGGPKAFIAAVSKIAGTGLHSPPEQAAVKSEAPAAPPAPLYGGAPAAPPANFSELTLQGISGSKAHRLAMINNRTLSTGESATIKVADGKVRVRCVEIREKSVIVAVDGNDQRRELHLRERM